MNTVPTVDLQNPPAATQHQTLILIATILASSLSFVDGSVVNVALPAIAQGLNADAGELQWVVSSYLLPLSALLLLGGYRGRLQLSLLLLGISHRRLQLSLHLLCNYHGQLLANLVRTAALQSQILRTVGLIG